MTQTRIPKGYKLLVTMPFSGQGRYMCHQIWAGNQEVTSYITWVSSVLPCLRYIIAALTSADWGATPSRLEITLPVCGVSAQGLERTRQQPGQWYFLGPSGSLSGGRRPAEPRCVCGGGTGSDGKQGHSHFLLWVPRSLNYACGGQRTAMITDAVYTAPWRSLLHRCRASFPSWH